MNQLSSQSAPNIAALNLACGGKLCHQTGWINADHNPSSSKVMKVNLLKKLPFSDNTFDIVYHSQFIEHLPLNLGADFLKECCRVLKPNGILRIVTPDLKDQASEYIKTLNEVLRDPLDIEAKLKYDWIRLEMLDQLTRQKPGGDMVSFLSKFGVQIQSYLRLRLGRSGDWMILSPDSSSVSGVLKSIKQLLSRLIYKLNKIIKKMIPEVFLVGSFRLSGEAHLCMYDEYLLSSILKNCGFTKVERLSAKKSHIKGWSHTLLDSDEQGNPDCPASLFMEAVKSSQIMTSNDEGVRG